MPRSYITLNDSRYGTLLYSFQDDLAIAIASGHSICLLRRRHWNRGRGMQLTDTRLHSERMETRKRERKGTSIIETQLPSTTIISYGVPLLWLFL